MKMHSCLLTFLAYLFFYCLYYFAAGLLLSFLFTDMNSSDSLALTVLLSAVLALGTAIWLVDGRQITVLYRGIFHLIKQNR